MIIKPQKNILKQTANISALVGVIINALSLKYEFFKIWFLFSSLENKNAFSGKTEKLLQSQIEIEKTKYL